jgi:hypothetical protein
MNREWFPSLPAKLSHYPPHNSSIMVLKLLHRDEPILTTKADRFRFAGWHKPFYFAQDPIQSCLLSARDTNSYDLSYLKVFVAPHRAPFHSE